MNKVRFMGLMLAGMSAVAAAQGRAPLTISVASLQVPAEARGQFELARLAVLGGRKDEYEREIKKALELDRNFAEAYVLRAAQELTSRDYEAALTDSYVAERLDGGLSAAKMVRASALNGLRQFGEAWAVLEGLDRFQGETWEAKYERARAAVGLRDTAGALRWSAETLEVVPVESLDGARVLRGDALDMAGRYSEAIVVWRQYLASPRVQRYRAAVLVALARAERMSQTQEIAGVGR